MCLHFHNKCKLFTFGGKTHEDESVCFHQRMLRKAATLINVLSSHIVVGPRPCFTGLKLLHPEDSHEYCSFVPKEAEITDGENMGRAEVSRKPVE